MLLTPFKATEDSDTVQDGSSFEVSFMMQTLTRDWPTSPWVTANFMSWLSQTGPVLQCLGYKHCNKLHLFFLTTMELERSKEVFLLHIISWISEMPFFPQLSDSKNNGKLLNKCYFYFSQYNNFNVFEYHRIQHVLQSMKWLCWEC